MATLIAIFNWLNGLDNAITTPFVVVFIAVVLRDIWWREETSWLQVWLWYGAIALNLIPVLWNAVHGHADIISLGQVCFAVFWLWMIFRDRPPPPRKRHPLKEASAAIRAMMERLREHMTPGLEPA